MMAVMSYARKGQGDMGSERVYILCSVCCLVDKADGIASGRRKEEGERKRERKEKV